MELPNYSQHRLLIIDDDKDIRDYYRTVAEELGVFVFEAGTVECVIQQLGSCEPTIILLDLCMPDADGVETLRLFSDFQCNASIIVASGRDERVLQATQRVGNSLGLRMIDCLQKPVSIPDLEGALANAACRFEIDVGATKFAVRSGRKASPNAANSDNPDIDALVEAIDCDQLEVHYQPKITLATGLIDSCEALVRWRCPQRGLVPPGSFIPLAEDAGLIGDITDIVVQKAIAQMGVWKSQGFQLPVSVNLSPTQLTDLALPDRIAQMLAQANILAENLVVEVTEQAAMADISSATDILTRLRLKNISVSLDDFGAGYSSLSEMYRLPLSELKFDRSLITDLDSSEDARIVVRALVALTKTLGVPVCAEGIETIETADFLRSIECEKAQGFYFSRPLTPEAMADFLEVSDPPAKTIKQKLRA